MINLLVSYFYWNKGIEEILIKNKGKYRLIVDSGAYSASSLGKTIDLDAYCKFLDSIYNLQPFKSVQLDIIGDHERTQKNLEIMIQRGYQVVPVFTRGNPVESLDLMYSNSDLIMTGGIVKGNATKNYLKWFHQVNHNRPVHWLGFVDLSFIRVYKPTSVDSSTWTSAVRFGELCLLLNGKMQRIHKKTFARPPTRQVMEAILSLGIPEKSIKDLAFNGNWKNTTSGSPFVLSGKGLHRTINALSWVKFSQQMEANFGTHVYLVCVAASEVNILLSADNYLASN